MILSRLVSIFLRFGQFVSAAVCLGLSAWFLHEIHDGSSGPHKRTIYVIVIACVSLVTSLIWMIPFTFTFFHYPFDLILSLAWFAAFGALVEYINSANCGGAFHWGGLYRGGWCDKWKANEAFAFIAACFWLASTLLGAWVFHKKSRPVVVDGAGPRNRFGRRSYV
ncbi:putative integral membrane protein [Diplodia seriata]|uniref:Putative integral membrane protein n=1 Tax=Diplodia seriata TaxID=420778 RepID=A0A0G2HEN7_9PEZI|nr:putative integral membrane protein [Diplodia seriata]